MSMSVVMKPVVEQFEQESTIPEHDLAEARMLLEWARGIPEHRLSFETWSERELTRAARSA